MYPFVDAIHPWLCVLRDHVMYLCVFMQTVCVWHLQGWQDCKAASSSFFMGEHFPQGEQTWFISPQDEVVRMVDLTGAEDTVSTWVVN